MEEDGDNIVFVYPSVSILYKADNVGTLSDSRVKPNHKQAQPVLSSLSSSKASLPVAGMLSRRAASARRKGAHAVAPGTRGKKVGNL